MPKYVINEQSDLATLAKELEESTNKPDVPAQPGEKPVHEITPEEAPPSARGKPGATARNKTQKRPLPMGIGIGAAAGVLVLLVIVVAGAVTARKQLQVPDLYGEQSDSAISQLTRLGFQVTVEYDTASRKPAGTVVAQLPSAGTRLRAGSKLVVRVAGKAPADAPPGGVLSLGNPRTPSVQQSQPAPRPAPQPAPGPDTPDTPGPETPPADTPKHVAVPPVVGMTADEARLALQATGLKFTEETASDTDKPTGTVVSVEPKAGTEVPPGASVQLRVSARPATTAAAPPERQEVAMVAMPDCVRLSGKDAATMLWRLGLRPSWAYQENTTLEPGTVISTDPLAGSRLPIGSKVTLLLSK